MDTNTQPQKLHSSVAQQTELIGHCAEAIEGVHADLQHTKCVANQIFKGTKAITSECGKDVLEVQGIVQQT